MNNSNYMFGNSLCIAVFGFGLVYAVTTLLGFLAMESARHPIPDPYFTIMEILTVLIALLMTICLAAMHVANRSGNRIFSLLSLVFMSLASGITSCVHVLLLSLRLSTEESQWDRLTYFFSFKWPSVVYVLDILAWDLFFGLAMICAALVMQQRNPKSMLSLIFLLSGGLSLIGLFGIPLQNMQIRNIGILGYAVAGPIAFLLMRKVLGQPATEQEH